MNKTIFSYIYIAEVNAPLIEIETGLLHDMLST